MLTLLGSITIDWSVEWLGIIASAIILVSFLFSKQLVTRLINMVGCVAFVIYALVYIQSFSTAFMNGALFIVHIIFIVKDYLARKKNKDIVVNAEQSKSAYSDNESANSTNDSDVINVTDTDINK